MLIHLNRKKNNAQQKKIITLFALKCTLKLQVTPKVLLSLCIYMYEMAYGTVVSATVIDCYSNHT